MQTSADSLT